MGRKHCYCPRKGAWGAETDHSSECLLSSRRQERCLAPLCLILQCSFWMTLLCSQSRFWQSWVVPLVVPAAKRTRYPQPQCTSQGLFKSTGSVSLAREGAHCVTNAAMSQRVDSGLLSFSNWSSPSLMVFFSPLIEKKEKKGLGTHEPFSGWQWSFLGYVLHLVWL